MQRIKAPTSLAGAILAASIAVGAMVGPPALASPGSCEPVDLTALRPADTGGVTFSGTYLGDSALDESDQHPLLHSWSVDEVYAGSDIPADLVFASPACEWTNLTPGVRYVFSTASTAPSIPSPNATTPGVRDSLAWEILGNDRVRLAPFDTYQTGDYSAEVSSIETVDDVLLAVGGGEASPPSPPESPGFGCVTRTGPEVVADAQGTTLIGRYVGRERLPSGNVNIDDRRVFWSVEETLAGTLLPEVLTARSPGCEPVGLKPGERYVFSTSSIESPSVSNSLAWRVKADGSTEFAPFKGTDARDYPAEVRSLKTVDAVAEALGVDAGDSEQPARAGDRTPG